MWFSRKRSCSSRSVISSGLGAKGVEALQRVGAVGVEAEVLPDRRTLVVAGRRGWWRGKSRARSGRGAVTTLTALGLVRFFRRAEYLEGGDFHGWRGEGAEERGEVFRAEEGFIALDVDIDLRGVGLGDRRGRGLSRFGAPGDVRTTGQCVAGAEVGDFLRVGWR